MASGDSLIAITPQAMIPWDAVSGVYQTIDSGTYNHFCVEFPTAVDRYVSAQSLVPQNYTAAASIEVYFHWSSPGTNAAQHVTWGFQVERHLAGTTDMGAESFAAAQSVDDNDIATADVIMLSDALTLTNAQADAIAVGDSVRFLIWRLGSSGSDDLAVAAHLHRVEIREA